MATTTYYESETSVMSAVPENWIPFLPVHVPGDTRRIQLKRATLPSAVDGRLIRPTRRCFARAWTTPRRRRTS